MSKIMNKSLLSLLKPRVIKKFYCIVQARLPYRGGLYCIGEARAAYQIWEACVCIAEARGGRGFPPSHGSGENVHVLIIVKLNGATNSRLYIKTEKLRFENCFCKIYINIYIYSNLLVHNLLLQRK